MNTVYYRAPSDYNWNFQLLSMSTPVKHDALKRCWFNVGPPSTMLAQL